MFSPLNCNWFETAVFMGREYIQYILFRQYIDAIFLRVMFVVYFNFRNLIITLETKINYEKGLLLKALASAFQANIIITFSSARYGCSKLFRPNGCLRWITVLLYPESSKCLMWCIWYKFPSSSWLLKYFSLIDHHVII